MSAGARRDIPEAVLRKQIAASHPGVSAFVAANAGSGKTHVLTQRVIRLLLDGVDPAKILCITFTKAAASNMASRVFERLRAWITLNDGDLDAAIKTIGVTRVGPKERERARKLFALALETPGGLKVQTVHALCTRLLQQFPFEAHVPARFEVLDERSEQDLLSRATLGALLAAAATPDSPDGRALATGVAVASDQTFQDVVREAIRQRGAIERWIGAAGSLDLAITQVSRALGVDPGESADDIERRLIGDALLPAAEWPRIATLCRESTKTDQEQCERLTRAATATGRAQRDAYVDIFIAPSTRTPRKSVVTGSFAKQHPGLAQLFRDEQARVVDLVARLAAATTRDRSAALLRIAHAAIARYQDEKGRRGLLDYDDLIAKTLAMLTATAPTWVHYKLDMGIDHVLIDEAQDTSPDQWEIVKSLTAEFAAGAGARGVTRSIFAVGDEKQSIFSFQGAAPRKFEEMRHEFQKTFQAAGLAMDFIKLDYSFRSGENVLGAVDAVFEKPDMRASVTADADGMAPHMALSDAAPGLVEIWELEKPEDREPVAAWRVPLDTVSETSASTKLARRIAKSAGAAIARGERQARDILILVRQRGALFEDIIRALKTERVPVAGADRLTLTEHIAVVDLMALGDAILLPQDDLALATVLKSPLFGFDEDALFRLAYDRENLLGVTSLRDALAIRAREGAPFAQADALMTRCEREARRGSPFGFYAWLLGPLQGRAAIVARLGGEATDALDEFLALAFDHERRETPSLQGFLGWLRAADTEIKRDMEMSRNEVRVMTVHGAKGLEAPLVILADTTTKPSGAHAMRLIGLPAHGAPNAPACLIWAGRKDADTAALATARQRALDDEAHEHRRLLYVAMTRAAHHLVVCGHERRVARPAGCWYDLVFDGLTGRPGFDAYIETDDDGERRGFRYRKVADAAATPVPLGPPPTPLTLPAWLTRPAPVAVRTIETITPSRADESSASAPRHALATTPQNHAGRAAALRRGQLFHRLMQSLPEIAPERRRDAALGFLARQGDALSLEERETCATQALGVLADARFAPLFAPGSRAEVPLVGCIARPGMTTLAVSGQADRLVVTPDAVLIADFKTNSPAPATLADTPAAYVRQLALYRALLAKLYPDRAVRAAVVWTDGPSLMEVPAAVLDAAFGVVAGIAFGAPHLPVRAS